MRIGSLLLTLGVLLALAGCAPAASPPSSSTPSATPVFASDAEALKAAETAYAAYLKVSDQVAQDGWKDPSRLKPFARGEALARDKATANQFAAKSLTQVGSTRYDSAKVEGVSERGRGMVVVTMYLCVDVSGVDVRGPDGTSVVPKDRQTRVPLEVDVDNFEETKMKVSRNDAWSGTDFC
ncbi:hypothetical protein ACFPJ4_02265 [Lysinimonas soli]|uniref:Lipoprotein n=1 Tax=Lysinimonas soli TaxID=1074233 RepID=A0ABW0NL12_9MICO